MSALHLLGGDVFLSDAGEGTFTVQVNGAIQRWTIAETLARIRLECEFQAGSAA
jgi:hypothetical protein